MAVIKYLVKAQFGYRTAWGRINWRAAEGGLPPRLVIGGQEVPWEKLGRMPMTLQGWQFRVEIRDRSEDM